MRWRLIAYPDEPREGSREVSEFGGTERGQFRPTLDAAKEGTKQTILPAALAC